jgi:hypothetical protein
MRNRKYRDRIIAGYCASQKLDQVISDQNFLGGIKMKKLRSQPIFDTNDFPICVARLQYLDGLDFEKEDLNRKIPRRI